MSGCKDLTGSQPLPSGTVNPAFYHTAAGAIGLRAQALAVLEKILPTYLVNTGRFSDELESNTTGLSPTLRLSFTLTSRDAVNARLLPETDPSMGPSTGIDFGDVIGVNYTDLQAVRADLSQARAAIAAYDTGTKAIGDPKILRAELFALEGYTEILLADFFCSGVPLSTLDFNGDYTYHAGSPTAAVYHAAITVEDSALALADTSLQVQYLARVLKGRALLDSGDVAAAAQVVATVPDDFQYRLAINFHSVGASDPLDNQLNSSATLADTEGHNGLPYLSSNDPRSAATVTYAPGEFDLGLGNGVRNAVPLTFPSKYHRSGFSPFVVASGVEARLIAAEAARKVGDASWLTTLNALRATATVPGQTGQPPATLTDPGTDSARVALLFQERAYWFFLTGHRQGDLRRLLRQYRQWFHTQDQVYPTGPYTGVGTLAYGSDVTAPIPSTEYLNPLFHGCLDRDP